MSLYERNPNSPTIQTFLTSTCFAHRNLFMLSSPLPHELNVLFITSKAYPLTKIRGLGDVSTALPATSEMVSEFFKFAKRL
jgi:hypothetical protein